MITDLCSGYKADFERIRAAVEHREPDLVPLGELVVDDEVKSALIGREVLSDKDRVDFHVMAGYDFLTAYASTGLSRKPMASNEQRTSETRTSYGKKELG